MARARRSSAVGQPQRVAPPRMTTPERCTSCKTSRRRSQTQDSTAGRGVYASTSPRSAASRPSACAWRTRITTRPERPRAQVVAADKASRVPSTEVAMTYAVLTAPDAVVPMNRG